MDGVELYDWPVIDCLFWFCECKCVTDKANEEISSQVLGLGQISFLKPVVDIDNLRLFERQKNLNIIFTKSKRDDRNTVAKPARKSNFQKLDRVAAPIALLLLVTSIPGAFSKGVNVEWKLKKEPVIFGQDLHLQCQIDDKENYCKKNHREWLGGKDYDLLCKDGVCLNERKCTETMDEMCTYTLVVYNVTEDDINCPYTCSYGVHHQRKDLMLDEHIFIYDPTSKKEMIKKNISFENGGLSIFIQIEKVYPAPECVILFENHQISKTEDKNTTLRSDGFFKTEVKVASRLSTCKGVLKMKCRIGKVKREVVYVDVDYCKVDEETHKPWMWFALIFVCTIAAVQIGWLMLEAYKNIQNRNTSRTTTGIGT